MSKTPPQTAAPTQVRLLLVDDHPLVRDGLRARLNATTHLRVVGEAGSGEEALQLAEELQPDLALTDISMRGMNGIELVQQLRQRQPQVRALVLSMYDNGEYIANAMRAGASGYVLKDAPTAEIISAIETVAAGGSYFSAPVMAALATAPEKNASLTEREREILLLLVEGHSNKRIAQQLDISVRTVETHRMSLRRKLGIVTSAGLVKYALEQGWIKGGI